MSSLASLSPFWKSKSHEKRPLGERKLKSNNVNSNVGYVKALSPEQRKFSLSLLPTECICLLCNGIGVRAKKVCDGCHGSGLQGEYERVR